MTTSSTNFEDALAKATARGSNIIPAVVLSAIDHTGKSIYSKTSGYHGLAPDAPPVSADATFWLASCTKLAASIAALQCVERGLFTLDEPVDKILPELASPQIVSSTDDNKTVSLAPAKTKITLRHLLTHTSGFAYEWAQPGLAAWRASNGSGQTMRDLAGTVTKLYDHPLLFEPGEGWAYGPGIDWAGVMVERANGGVTLGDYMLENIFGRLGGGDVGRSTTFRLHSAAAKEAKIRDRLLPNANRQEDGTLVEKAYGFSEDVQEDSGGAGWYSSVPDYVAILQDLISAEPKLLKKKNLEEWLFKPHITNDNAVRQLVKARTAMTPEGDSVSDLPINYALGGLLFVKDGLLPKGSLSWVSSPELTVLEALFLGPCIS